MYNSFSEELIEEIRINNDIADIVSEYVKLEHRGKNLIGLCPFHKEKTPSFNVVPANQYFHCFGCGKGGNVIHFIMGCENLDFVEALKLLADKAHIQLPEGESIEEIEKAKLKQEIIKINTEAARFFFNNLKSANAEKARQYVKKREISEQVLKKFGVGYSPDEWDILYKYLLEKGFDDEVIIKSGLVVPNKNGSFYDKFRSRLMFPIFDVRGNVIAFGGRIIENSLPTDKKPPPKYMNSPETLAFNKGRHLYALNYAKTSGGKRLVVVEGYMDVISLHQYGITNSVAPLGTALTENQGRILKKYAEEIILSNDADTAGQAATLRGLDLLNDIGCNVKVLIIPKGKDPDEFIRKNGAQEFVKLINNSLSLLEYKIKVLRNGLDTETVDDKINFLNKVSEILSKIENRVEREMYVIKFAKEYGISEDSINSEIYRRARPNLNSRSAVINSDLLKKTQKSHKQATNKLVHDERFVLALICLDNSIYSVVKDSYGLEDFTDEENRSIAKIIFEKLANKKDISPAELMNILKSETASDFIRIINDECHCEDNKKAVAEKISNIKVLKIEERKKEIFDLLRDDGIDNVEVENLKKELNLLVMMGRKI